MRLLPLAILAPALVSLTGCDFEDFGGIGKFTRDFHYNYPMNAKASLNLETFNGSIDIASWDQNTIDINGTKYGPTQADADDLQVNISHTADEVTIRVIRPAERRNNLGARFTIRLPRTVHLDRITSSNGSIHTMDGLGPARFKSSNGAIKVEGLRGDLDAATSNSAIELMDVEGNVTAHTSNGRVRADRLLGTLDATTSNGAIQAVIEGADRPVRVETSNGVIDLTLPRHYDRDLKAGTSNSSITVHLPSDANAHVVAQTSNSSIASDFDMTMRGEFSKNRLDAMIGSGGPLIDLHTSNGHIKLARM
jgi:DUF4097 and DUF4098 domain-containing protein YvlB